MAFNKITESQVQSVYVKSAADRLSGTPTQNKNVFDKLPELIVSAFNSLIEQLNTGGGGDIQISYGGGNVSLQNAISAIATDIANRYTKTESDTKLATTTNPLVKSVTFNSANGVFTITKADGTVSMIDTALEKVPATFELVESGGKWYLKITNIDGTATQTDISELMNEYVFNDSTTIDFTTTTGANGVQSITAVVKDNSIDESKLTLSFISTLQGYVSSASGSASAAANSASAAAKSASEADTASASAIAASGNALTSENNASASATQASTSATQASGSAAQANASALNSQSWAVGGTNTRTGEDNDNAKYYAEQAKAAAGGDYVSTSDFNTAMAGKVPTTRKVNNKALSSDITLTATDVNARPNTWIPTATEVGARPNTWTPTADDVGAYTEAEVDALLNKYLPLDGSKAMTGDALIIGNTKAAVSSYTSRNGQRASLISYESADNFGEISIYSASKDLENMAFMARQKDGVYKSYNLYGEHNKGNMPFPVIRGGTNVDFDTLTKAGIYSCDYGEGTNQSAYHTPINTTAVCWYNVIVYVTAGSRTSQLATQCYTGRNSNRTFTRTLHDTTWSEWKELSVGGTPTVQPLPLASGWSAKAGGKASYYKDTDGTVVVNFSLIKSSAITDFEIIATLPTGFRPSEQVVNSAVASDAIIPCTVYISPTGIIKTHGNYTAQKELFGTLIFKAAN